MKQQVLNVGDLVVIRDYSYALRLGRDRCTNYGSCEPNARQKFKVLVTGCNMPTYWLGELQRCADTIVMGQDDGVVWLVHSALVAPVIERTKQEVTDMAELKCKDGTVVQISDETEQELRKAFEPKLEPTFKIGDIFWRDKASDGYNHYLQLRTTGENSRVGLYTVHSNTRVCGRVVVQDADAITMTEVRSMTMHPEGLRHVETFTVTE